MTQLSKIVSVISTVSDSAWWFIEVVLLCIVLSVLAWTFSIFKTKKVTWANGVRKQWSRVRLLAYIPEILCSALTRASAYVFFLACFDCHLSQCPCFCSTVMLAVIVIILSLGIVIFPYRFSHLRKAFLHLTLFVYVTSLHMLIFVTPVSISFLMRRIILGYTRGKRKGDFIRIQGFL